MGANALQFPVTLEPMTCGECGIEFAVPTQFNNARLRDHSLGWYCPNGHCRCYAGKTEAEKLREQLEEEQRLHLATANRLQAARAETAKIQNRVIKNGVCPCCHRSFVALRRHMATKHPDYPAKVIR